MTIDACGNRKEGLACIKKNTMDTLEAVRADANYPVENVLDDHPKKVWRSPSAGDACMSFNAGSGSNCLAIFGTNADSVKVSLSDPNSVAWERDVIRENLAALDEMLTSIAVTDVFVRDLRNDYLGGEWRERNKDTSWYQEELNTAIRGATRDIPAIVAIVVDAYYVTYFDVTAPGLPMWMVFEGHALNFVRNDSTSVEMRDGLMCVGSDSGSGANGLVRISFIEDNCRLYTSSGQGLSLGNVAERNDYKGFSAAPGAPLINGFVNDVAITIIDDAPIDPATNIAVPTIAVATDGGVSVIDGPAGVNTVVNSAQTFPTTSVKFLANNNLQSTVTGTDRTVKTATDYSTDGFTWDIQYSDTSAFLPIILTGAVSGVDGAIASSSGLTLLDENITTPSEGSVAYITDDYNTGWMKGDIRLATLSDTVTGDLVAFDTTPTTSNANVTASGNVLSTTASATGELGKIPDTGFPVGTPVMRLRAAVDLTAGNVDLVVYKVWATGTNTTTYSFSASGVEEITFGDDILGVTAKWESGSGFEGSLEVETFSPILDDRCVKSNDLAVLGTITRTAVATNAELMAYSGFSVADYIEQPYTADLDEGTGDMHVGLWVRQHTQQAAGEYIYERAKPSDASVYFYIRAEKTSGDLNIGMNGMSPIIISDLFIDQEFHKIDFVRKDGLSELFINGISQGAPSTSTGTQTKVDAITRIGLRAYLVQNPATGCDICLVRNSATAPTEEDILKWYTDEKELFKANAKCTLQGSSTSVQSLSYDSKLEEFHAGTSDGLTIFKGIEAISHARSGQSVTSVSADNGIYLTGTPLQSEIFIPAIRRVEWEAGVEWDNTGFVSGQEFTLNQQGNTYALWLDFENTSEAPIKVDLVFSSTSRKVIEVGVIRCGISYNADVNPQRPMTEELVDYSIVRELSNGATYVKKRDIVREFSGELYLARERDFYNFMYGVAREIGQQPIAWKITDINLIDWIVFGRLTNMPVGRHSDPDRSRVNFKIREVL